MQNEIIALVKTITRNEMEKEQLQQIIQQLQAKVKELGSELEKFKDEQKAQKEPPPLN